MIVMSSHDICMACKCAPDWDETCNMMHCENDLLELVPPPYMACEYSKGWETDQSMVQYEKQLFQIVLSNKRCMIFKRSKKRCKTCNFQNKKLFYQYFEHLLSSIFLTISKSKILEYSFHHNLMRRHDYCTFWLEQCLLCISASITYSHYIFTERRKGGKTRGKKIEKKEKKSNEYVGRNHDFKSYFCAGGRHQTTLDGEIICKYLECCTCTDIKLLNDSKYFKGKCFEFKGYELLNASPNDVGSTGTLFFSKIPLDQLSNYLNVKEL